MKRTPGESKSIEINKKNEDINSCVYALTQSIKTPKASKERMDEILEFMKQRKEQKNKSEAQYQKLEKEIKNKCREAKGRWYNQQCEEIE